MSSSSIAVSRRCASSGTEHKAHKGASRQKSQKKEHRARKPEVAFSPVLKRRESWAARPPADWWTGAVASSQVVWILASGCLSIHALTKGHVGRTE